MPRDAGRDDEAASHEAQSRPFDSRYDDSLFVRERRASGGRGDGRTPPGTLFWIHGLGESGLCFERLLTEPRLAHWHHLAYDLPGYGKSLHGDPVRTVDQLAKLLGARIEAAQIGPLVIVGHSMGGVIGLDMAYRLRQVRGFVNVEGNVSLGDCTGSAKAAAYELDDFLGEGFDRLLADTHAAGRDDDALRGYYVSMRLCDPRAFHRNSVDLIDCSLGERQATLQAQLGCPHVYVAGIDGGACLRSRALLARADVPVRAIPRAGHWPYLDQHDRFVDVLTTFLDTVGADAPEPSTPKRGTPEPGTSTVGDPS